MCIENEFICSSVASCLPVESVQWSRSLMRPIRQLWPPMSHFSKSGSTAFATFFITPHTCEYDNAGLCAPPSLNAGTLPGCST